MRSLQLVLIVLLMGISLLGKPVGAAETPVAPAGPAAVESPAVATEATQPPPPQTQPAAVLANPLVTGPDLSGRRHPALRNTGITMAVLGAAQLVAGGVLYGLATANCHTDRDCGNVPHEFIQTLTVFTMGVGGIFVMLPGAIMWGAGARL